MHDILTGIDGIKAFRRGILKRRHDLPLFQRSLADVKKVVIINSSSRSGSSLLYALLGRLPKVYALTGEAAPFYKLNTRLGGFDPHRSDRLPSGVIDDVIDPVGVSQDFISDLFLSGSEPGQIDCSGYVDDLMLRFSLQWTDIVFDPEALRQCISDVLEHYQAGGGEFVTEEFYLRLLKQLVLLWPRIDPFYYDIGTDKVALRFPSLEIPSGPPVSRFTIEEPPFILMSPRCRPTVADLSEKTLLLKSTVDCYRMNLVERLFPDADIRIIHLIRNPAATINGIFDGWHHRGFFSHNLEHSFDGRGGRRLNIKGYSDLYSFGSTWWNFDLPEGWESVADGDLVDVCAFQWHSANSEILENLSRGCRKSCRVHFEDIIRSSTSRKTEFERMLDFMEFPAEQVGELRLDVLPLVQSTLPPQLYRWKRREDMIAKVLSAPRIREMAEVFGYLPDSMEAWL